MQQLLNKEKWMTASNSQSSETNPGSSTPVQIELASHADNMSNQTTTDQDGTPGLNQVTIDLDEIPGPNQIDPDSILPNLNMEKVDKLIVDFRKKVHCHSFIAERAMHN